MAHEAEASVKSDHSEKDKTYPKTHTGKSFENVNHIVNRDGKYLFCKYWNSEKQIRALVFFVHGYAEHCGRYQELAEKLAEMGVFSFSHDHVAHGESQGLRGYITDYKVLVRDIFQHIDLIKPKYPDLPIFLYGRSMGGALCAFLAAERPNFFRGCLFSSPYIQMSPDTATPFLIFMAKVVGRVAPKLRVGKLDFSYLSRSQKAIDDYVNDPLNDTGGMRAVCAIQFMEMVNNLKEVIPKIDCPMFVASSEIDKISAFCGAKFLAEVSKSEDKTFRAYKDALHLLEHELPEFTESYFEDVAQWIKERI